MADLIDDVPAMGNEQPDHGKPGVSGDPVATSYVI